MATSSVEATMRYASGIDVIVSPCDIHTCDRGESDCISASSGSTTRICERPYSRLADASTRPPKKWARYCAP